MSEIQIFQVLGLLFFASGLGLLINPGFGKKLLENLTDYPMFTYLSSLIVLVAGFYLVSFFNVWAWDWTLLLTLTGWAALIKGVTMLIFPGLVHSWISELKDSYVTVKAIAAAVLGFVYLALGFLMR